MISQTETRLALHESKESLLCVSSNIFIIFFFIKAVSFLNIPLISKVCCRSSTLSYLLLHHDFTVVTSVARKSMR